jgi:hypothetical protein
MHFKVALARPQGILIPSYAKAAAVIRRGTYTMLPSHPTLVAHFLFTTYYLPFTMPIS